VFLGVRFQCAKCHDHPFEKWTQDQYYQLGAFFSGVDSKPGRLPGEEIVFTKFDDTEMVHPKTAKPVVAKVPYGSTHRSDSERERLAQWLASANNPLFAKSIANRYWSYFFGKGIIEPVDDIRSSNPPSNPELLDALAKDFIENGFDLKELIRTICRSRTYQQSMITNQWNEDDTTNFSHAIPRRLTAEQLLDSISLVTGSPQEFEGLPEGFRACQLPDSEIVSNDFLALFGRPERDSACECERTSELSLAHAMNLINGETVSNAINDPQGRIAKLLNRNADQNEMIQELYLATLSRMPNPDEMKTAIAYFAEGQNVKESAQDLLWALMNSPAFLFNR